MKSHICEGVTDDAHWVRGRGPDSAEVTQKLDGEAMVHPVAKWVEHVWQRMVIWKARVG